MERNLENPRVLSSMGPVQIIRFDNRYARDTLGFLAANNPDHPELGDRELFEWQDCARYLALMKGRVVGHMAIIPQVFSCDGKPLAMGWGSTLVLDMNDFAVKTFAGVGLIEVCFDDPSYIYAGVGIVPQIEGAYKRKGYVLCRGSAKMYARFFRPAKAFAYYEKPQILSMAIRVANLVTPIRGKAGGPIREIAKFDAAWDGRWQELLARRYAVFGSRTAAFLNYKMSQPHKRYYAFMHDDGRGEPDGYIIFRQARHNTKDLNIVRICDLVGTDVARGDLIARALAFAAEIGVDGVVAVSSTRDRGFFRKSGLWLEKDLPIGLKPELACKIHLSFFDSDLDNLW
jgi:hypothetical protein